MTAPAGTEVATILVAEDHADSREAFCTLLEAYGYRVLTARNGREAVEVALAEHPELVLMDLMMPELDGLGATRELRASAAFTQVPILAVTAMEGAVQTSREAGCDALLAKPIDVRALLDAIREWLERASTRE
jgi:CheY-like chemotaxis protein